MKLTFLHKSESNRRLILIFSGWSTGARFYEGITKDSWDIAVVTDYSSKEFPRHLLHAYPTVYVYAWSLGVKAAETVLTAEDFTRAFAVNGSGLPADDSYGIPSRIYQATGEGLNQRNLSKFRRRMLERRDEELLERMATDAPQIEALRLELDNLRKYASNTFPWVRSYVGRKDSIFPSDNLVRFWQEKHPETALYVLEEPHYIDLKRIIDSTIPDVKRVGSRFASASATYDVNASAQRSIALRLADIATADGPVKAGGRVLEIGQGTGLFTRAYVRGLRPERIDFVDLYPTPEFHFAPEENYFTADAETWLEDCHTQYDYILSASSIQWFCNPERFFRNSAARLAAGGKLVCSTFLKGTLGELDAVRPSPMLYVSESELRRLASRYFETVSVSTEDIVIEFDSPREAILHLKRTGVGGAFLQFGSARKLLEALTPSGGNPALTYRAYYLKASNPK